MSFKTHNYFLGNIPHDNHFSNVSSQKTITTSIITNAINKMKPSTDSSTTTTTKPNYLVASPDQSLQSVIDKASVLLYDTEQPVVIYALPGVYSDVTLNINSYISIVADSLVTLNLSDLTLNGIVNLTNITINVYNIHLGSTNLGLIMNNCRINCIGENVCLDLSLLYSSFIEMTNSFFGNENNISIQHTGGGILNMTLTQSKLYGGINISSGSGQLNFNSSEIKGTNTGFSITDTARYLVNIQNCRLWTNIVVGEECQLYLFNSVLENLGENLPTIIGDGVVWIGNVISRGALFNIFPPGQLISYVTTQLG